MTMETMIANGDTEWVAKGAAGAMILLGAILFSWGVHCKSQNRDTHHAN